MQMDGGIAGAAALRRDDLDQIAHRGRINRAQKRELLVRDHDSSPFASAQIQFR
jgi:hypothetical protein